MNAPLPQQAAPASGAVDARRRRLFVAVGLAVLCIAGIATVPLFVDGSDLPGWVAWALLAATVLFLLAVAVQERTLSALTRALTEQQRREAELEATVSDLEALVATARRINAVLLPEEVYDVVLDAAVELLQADSGSIRLRVGDLLAVAASSGAHAPTVGSAVAVEDDPAVLVVTLGVDVVEEDPPRLALPITVGERHVGVLEVQRTADGQPFTQRLALLGRLLAEEAATAVVNANRYDLERSRAEELTSDREVRTDAIADTVHDLRVPLSGLMAYAELLRDRYERLDEPQRREAVDGVHDAATRLRRLVDEVFEAAATEARAARRRERIELDPLVRAAATSAEATGLAPGARIEVDCSGDPVALGDPEALERVLGNLLCNALEHGSPAVRVRVVQRRGEVRVHVADRGAGIPPDELGTLFRRRTRADGSPRGRGLGIVDSLVRAMGGRVGVRSQQGVGSVFTVTLPTED